MSFLCVSFFTSHVTLATCIHVIFPCVGLTEHAPIECGGRSLCPHPCRCAEGIVDCREKSLSTVPLTLPEDTTEM